MTTHPAPRYVGCRFPLSLRMVEDMLAARGITVSHKTVRQWGLTFGREIADRLRRRTPCRGDKWHLDEVVLTIAGKKHYLWRAVDQDGFVLDVLVRSRRDKKFATVNGTARAGQDFRQRQGTLTFRNGEVEKTITITVSDDRLFEGDETFSVVLRNPRGATLEDDTALATIVDNDPPPNNPPAVGERQGDLTVMVGQAVELALPAAAFRDADGDALTRPNRTAGCAGCWRRGIAPRKP